METNKRKNYIALAFLHAAPSIKRAAAALAMESGTVEALEESGLMGEDKLREVDRACTLNLYDFDTYNYIPICDSRYPAHLRSIADPPLGIFARGPVPSEWPSMVGIVGSRNCDREGVTYAREFSKNAAFHIPVVSGLALGIDGAAHRGALMSGSLLPTVAVIANGTDTVYPASHRQLGKEIIDAGGVIISEYPPGTRTYPNQFLERNRIIAGLSRALVVIQAAKRSGALVTARLALEYGRDVYALPWSLDNPRGEGCNKLIQDGAHVLLSPEELTESLGYRNVVAAIPLAVLSKEEREVIDLLKQQGKLHLDELKRQLGDSIDLIILNLELSRLVERIPGNFLTLGSG